MARGARSGVRRGRGSRPRQALALLAGALALILQLLLAPTHLATAAPADTTLAELTALTGQHGVLCAFAEDQRPDGPVHGDADCPGLCCQLGHGLAAFLPPPVPPSVMVGRSVAIALPAMPAPPPAARPQSAQPRGPPIPV
jgi:hypothetical protein